MNRAVWLLELAQQIDMVINQRSLKVLLRPVWYALTRKLEVLSGYTCCVHLKKSRSRMLFHKLCTFILCDAPIKFSSCPVDMHHYEQPARGIILLFSQGSSFSACQQQDCTQQEQCAQHTEQIEAFSKEYPGQDGSRQRFAEGEDAGQRRWY